MVPSEKLAIAVEPQTVTNAGTLTGYIDTLGFDYMTLDLVSGTVAAAKIPTVMKLAESDSTTVVTSMSDIVAFTGGTATSSTVGFVIPMPSTVVAGGYTTKFCVDLKARKRYLGVSFSPITTHTLSVVANLSRAEEAPVNTTKANVLALVEG